MKKIQVGGFYLDKNRYKNRLVVIFLQQSIGDLEHEDFEKKGELLAQVLGRVVLHGGEGGRNKATTIALDCLSWFVFIILLSQV